MNLYTENPSKPVILYMDTINMFNLDGGHHEKMDFVACYLIDDYRVSA